MGFESLREPSCGARLCLRRKPALPIADRGANKSSLYPPPAAVGFVALGCAGYGKGDHGLPPPFIPASSSSRVICSRAHRSSMSRSRCSRIRRMSSSAFFGGPLHRRDPRAVPRAPAGSPPGVSRADFLRKGLQQSQARSAPRPVRPEIRIAQGRPVPRRRGRRFRREACNTDGPAAGQSDAPAPTAAIARGYGFHIRPGRPGSLSSVLPWSWTAAPPLVYHSRVKGRSERGGFFYVRCLTVFHPGKLGGAGLTKPALRASVKTSHKPGAFAGARSRRA